MLELSEDSNQRTTAIEEKIKDLEKLIHTKVDCELFDEEMNNLKNLLAAVPNEDKQAITQIISSGPSISSKDLNKIKETAAKVAELEELLNKLLR